MKKDFEDFNLIEIGCNFCWDRKKQQSKELFFLDAANNMRICNYCPYCGRDYNEEVNYDEQQ